MKKLKQKGIGGIVSVIVGCFTGAAIMLHLLIATDGNIDIGGIKFVIFMLMYFIVSVLHVIIHEAGHLVFGLLSGYKFLSFRIFSNIWVKHDGKIVRKRYKIPGTAGQCLMWPPEYNGGDYSYALVHLGGGLMNIISGTIFLYAANLFYTGGYLWMFLIVMAYCGYSTAATNLIPMRISGMPNDGKNAIMMRNDPVFRMVMWKELYINACLTSGVGYDALEEWLYDTSGIGTDDLHSVYIHAVNGDRHMFRGEYEEALRIFDNILSNPLVSDSVSGLGVLIEKIFIMMLLGYDKDMISGLFSDKLRAFMKKMSLIPAIKRAEYAIEIYLNENINEALKKEAEFGKALENYPNISANILEKQLFLSFKEKYFAKFSENDV